MTAITRLFVFFFPVLALLACAQSPDKPGFAGHTCCNLHFEGDWISDANWSSLPMLAAGTPVSVLGYEKHRVVVEVEGRRMKLGLDYGREQDLEEWARRLVVSENPKPKIAQWPATVREAVHHGKVAIGMTKEQVIASVGYPPAHETPSLDAAQWRYWYGKLSSYLVAWDEAGRVKEIIAEPETRAAVMEQKATEGAKTEDAPAPVSGAQRAAVRRVSVVDTVSMPEKPDARTSYGLLTVTGGGIAPAVSVGMVLLQIAAGQTQNAASAEAFKKLLDANRINVAAIVRAEFSAALAESRAFSEVVADEGDARFRLKVETYGIADMPAGSDNAPFTQLFLRLNAELSTPGGDVIWRQSAGHASLDALLDPAQSGEGFRRVARVIVKDLLRDLPGFGANALPPPVPVAARASASGGATGSMEWQYRLVRSGISSSTFDYTVRSALSGQVIHETFSVPGRPDVNVILSVRETAFRTIALQPPSPLLEYSPYLDAAVADQNKSGAPPASGYPMGSVPQSPWRYAVNVLGWTQITTPAGSFRALQLTISGTRPAAAIGLLRAAETGRFVYTIWYSPEVQRYVKFRHEAWSMNGNSFGTDTVELIKHSPG